jgi:hypothetical protein
LTIDHASRFHRQVHEYRPRILEYRALTDTIPPANLDSMPEDELFFRLGRETIGDAIVPQSFDTLIERGRAVLAGAEPAVRAVLCMDGGVRDLLKDLSDEARKQQIPLLLAGTLTGFTHLAVILIGALVMRAGLDRYCATPVAAVASPGGDSQASSAASAAT